MELWNSKFLMAPPVNSCPACAKEIDIRLINIALKDGFDFFENQPALHTEAAVISRIIYRLKMKLRSSKEFKSLEKLSRLLRTYLQLDIERHLRTLLNCLPQFYKPNQTCIFTRNMLQYVLVRLQGLGKTLNRILETCKIAFSWTHKKLRIGHMWKVTIVIYAAISRVFVLAKNILRFTCELYDKLLPISAYLGNIGVQWLPQEYTFPSRLDQWLEIDWLELDKDIIEIKDDAPSLMAFLADDDDDDDDDVKFCDEYIVVKDDFSFGNSSRNTKVEPSLEYSDDDAVDISVTVFVKDEANKNDAVVSVEDTSDVDIGEVINISDAETPKPIKIEQQKSFPNVPYFIPMGNSKPKFKFQKKKKQKPGLKKKNEKRRMVTRSRAVSVKKEV